MNNIFSLFFRKKILGIDIGTSAIKIVELSRIGNTKVLENYAELKLPVSDNGEKTSSPEFLALAIKEMLAEARIKTKSVIFSVPDFSTFCTSFEIPAMTKEEIPGAILYNASQYITLPINEVTLDWQIMPTLPSDKNSSLKVFLVAIPNQIIEDYKTIAKLSGLDMHALEAEVLGIARALIKNNLAMASTQKTIGLIDIGAKSSTISIVDNGFVKMSYSFGFNASYLAKNNGADLKGMFEPLLAEIKSVLDEFFQKEKRKIQEIYLTGGASNFTGLKEELRVGLGMSVLVPNGFLEIFHNPALDKKLLEMSPSFSACLGVALGGLGN